MAQTPWSSSVPYCSAPMMLQFYAKPLVADMCRVRPTAPPPSYLALIDQSNPAGAKLYKHLKMGAGEIESNALVAKRYSPEDLQALTGVSQVLLQKLNAARAMWSLQQTLKPITARQEDVPAVKESAELIRMLRDGETIFGFVQSAEAGLPDVVPPRPWELYTPNTLLYANRLFPNFQINGPVNYPGYYGGNQ